MTSAEISQSVAVAAVMGALESLNHPFDARLAQLLALLAADDRAGLEKFLAETPDRELVALMQALGTADHADDFKKLCGLLSKNRLATIVYAVVSEGKAASEGLPVGVSSPQWDELAERLLELLNKRDMDQFIPALNTAVTALSELTTSLNTTVIKDLEDIIRRVNGLIPNDKIALRVAAEWKPFLPVPNPTAAALWSAEINAGMRLDLNNPLTEGEISPVIGYTSGGLDLEAIDPDHYDNDSALRHLFLQVNRSYDMSRNGHPIIAERWLGMDAGLFTLGGRFHLGSTLAEEYPDIDPPRLVAKERILPHWEYMVEAQAGIGPQEQMLALGIAVSRDRGAKNEVVTLGVGCEGVRYAASDDDAALAAACYGKVGYKLDLVDDLLGLGIKLMAIVR